MPSLNLMLLALLIGPAIWNVQQAAVRIQVHENLKQFGLAIVNDAKTPFTGHLTFHANSYSPGDHHLTVHTPQGDTTLVITPNGGAYSVPITAAPFSRRLASIGRRSAATSEPTPSPSGRALVTILKQRPAGFRGPLRRRPSASGMLM